MGDLARLGVAVENKGLGPVDAALTRIDSKFVKIAGSVVALNQGLQLLGRGARALSPLLSIGAQFEESMVKSTAIMGNLSNTMTTEMTQAARQVARESAFSADQAADAFYFLASAGLDAKQSIAALPLVTQFATAGAFDLATATDLLTDAQSALGLTIRDDVTKNMQNMLRVSDVLVKANTLANASVFQFSEALTNKAGPALRIVNKDVEEGVAVLAAMADQGVKGAEAGTQLSIVLRDLSRRGIENKEEMKKFGVEVFDADRNMRNLADIIEDLERALRGLSDEQARAAIMQMGFADRSVQAILALIGTSDAVRAYEASMRDAGDITQIVAERQLSALTKQAGMLKADFRDLAIQLFSDLAPDLKEVVSQTRAWIAENEDLIRQDLKGFVTTSAAEAKKLATAIDDLTEPLREVVGMVRQLPAETFDIGLLGLLYWGARAHPTAAAVATVAVIAPLLGRELREMREQAKLYREMGGLEAGSPEERQRLYDRAKRSREMQQWGAEQERKSVKRTLDLEHHFPTSVQAALESRLEKTGMMLDTVAEGMVTATTKTRVFINETGKVVGGMSMLKRAGDELNPTWQTSIVVIDKFGNALGAIPVIRVKKDVEELSDELKKLAAKITTEMQTPLEAWQSDVATLDKLHQHYIDTEGKAGISTETYRRKLADLVVTSLDAKKAGEEYTNNKKRETDAVLAFISALRSEDQALENEAERLRLSVRPTEALRKEIERLQDLRRLKPQSITADVYDDLVRDAALRLNKLERTSNSTLQRIEDGVQGLGASFKSVFGDIAAEGEVDFDRLFEAIRRDLAELAAEEFFIDPIFGGLKKAIRGYKDDIAASRAIAKATQQGRPGDGDAALQRTINLTEQTGQKFNQTINEFDRGFLWLLGHLSTGVGWFLSALLGGKGGFDWGNFFGSIGIGAATGLFGGVAKAWAAGPMSGVPDYGGSTPAPTWYEPTVEPGGSTPAPPWYQSSRQRAPAASEQQPLQIVNNFVFPSPDPKMAKDIIVANMPVIEARIAEGIQRGRLVISRAVGRR